MIKISDIKGSMNALESKIALQFNPYNISQALSVGKTFLDQLRNKSSRGMQEFYMSLLLMINVYVEKR